jgi:hypothetical protein
MNERTDYPFKVNLDGLSTPKQIADRGILSLVAQWKERKRGRLKFYQIGRKILYNDQHIFEFLESCENEGPVRSGTKKSKTLPR